MYTTVHDEQTHFQNITEISFLPSSFWHFIVNANFLLLGAYVLIVMSALQIHIDDDDDVMCLKMRQNQSIDYIIRSSLKTRKKETLWKSN